MDETKHNALNMPPDSQTPDAAVSKRDEGLDRFTKDQIVNVQRSSGEMENDWKVLGPDKESSGRIVVQKIIEGETGGPKAKKLYLTKSLIKELLEKWNP